MTETIFNVQDVVKIYNTGAGGFTALDGISFDVAKGEFLGIIGKSGAGKTTLLNMLSGVSEITSGKVLFTPQIQSKKNGDGQLLSVGEMSQDELSTWRGENMGIVYQSFELLPQLDLVDNIMLPQEFAGQYQAGISRERALALLDIVELSEHAYKLPAHISGGQKQRVAIARALINDPSLIVADEPTGNLDRRTADQVTELLLELQKSSGAILISVTHSDSLAAAMMRRLELVDGKLV